jgi:small subunit ribosomal protein S20
MANLKSSKKDIRRTKKRTLANKPFKRNALMSVKKIEKLVSAGFTKEASEMLSSAYKSIDKAAKKNIFHRNKAARMKARIAKMVAIK